MNSSFLTAIHITAYLAYPGNAGAPVAHIACYLTYAAGGGLVTSDQIADVLKTNPVVVRRLVGKLREANLVIAVRGKTGGYQLARPPSDISLLDLFLAVEADQMDFFALANRDRRPGCSAVANSIQQTLHPLLAQSLEALKQDLGRYSLAQVLDTSLDRLRDAAKPG